MAATATVDPVVGDLTEKLSSKQYCWNLIIWNDDVNSFSHVEDCLMKYLHFSIEKARETSGKVHKEGKAIAYAGFLERVEAYYEQLISEGLSCTISQ